MLKELFSGQSLTSVGSKFRNICFVGLNRVEFYPNKEKEPVFGDNWQDVTDEHSRKNMAMVFFAPRELDGEPVNPYTFLAGDDHDEETSALIQQALSDTALLDYCRVLPASANALNIVVVADVIFHWDIHDSYILPTNQFNWVRDLQQILKGYPRTTNVHMYTNWTDDKLQDLNIKTSPVEALPVGEDTWVNMPTFQEQYGTLVLIASLILAALTYGILSVKNNTIDALSEQIRIVQQQIPRESRFAGLNRAISDQEKHMKYRQIFPLIVKDAARTIQMSAMQIENFEIKSPKPQDTPKEFILTIEAKRDVYKGWLQEEPVAKALLANSAMLSAVRKPPGNTFKVEGLINLKSVFNKFKDLQKEKAKKAKTGGTSS